jgi:hypothetical protein
MDPYLEQPALWPGVHQRLITYIADTLNTLLPPAYVADIGERLYVVQPERSIYPDVVVVEHPAFGTSATSQETNTSAALGSDPPWILTLPVPEIREVFIEIVAMADASLVVTAIEVLSPSNKMANSPGRQLYVEKQRQLLQSQTHLIEVDLLRSGEHTVAPPHEELIRWGPWDYLVSLHRGGNKGERYEVWGIPLRQRLARIRVPLLGNDSDVVLDLQAVLDRCYDEGAYARRLDYRRQPVPPLSQGEATWADTLLRQRGLRQ